MADAQAAGEKLLLPADYKPVSGGVQFYYIQRLGGRQPQPLPLPHRIMSQPFMFAQYIAFAINDVSGWGGDVLCYKAAIISVRDEADVLALRLDDFH